MSYMKFQLNTNELDNIEETYEKCKIILKQSNDFQEENLILSVPDSNVLLLEIYPEDFVDPARSRKALKEFFNYIYERYL